MKSVILFFIVFLFAVGKTFANDIGYTSESSKNDYSLSIRMPTNRTKIDTTEMEIPFSYYLNNKSKNVNTLNPEIRVTFNLLNSNCFAFSVLHPKLNEVIKTSIMTKKCNITHPGDYMGYATICLKALSINDSATDLCKTIMGNIKVE